MSPDRNVAISLDRDDSGDVVLTLAGEIDLAAREDVRRHLVVAMQYAIDDERRLVLELSGVTFMDSTGVNAILLAARQLHERSLSLVVARPAPMVERVLDITGANRILTIEH